MRLVWFLRELLQGPGRRHRRHLSRGRLRRAARRGPYCRGQRDSARGPTGSEPARPLHGQFSVVSAPVRVQSIIPECGGRDPGRGQQGTSPTRIAACRRHALPRLLDTFPPPACRDGSEAAGQDSGRSGYGSGAADIRSGRRHPVAATRSAQPGRSTDLTPVVRTMPVPGRCASIRSV